jgi:hypothetical protein
MKEEQVIDDTTVIVCFLDVKKRWEDERVLREESDE